MEPVECDLKLPQAVLDEAAPYPADATPFFIGHYWMRGTKPEFLAHNVACVDWSVAKGGLLRAYRWGGETALRESSFAWVAAPSPDSCFPAR